MEIAGRVALVTGAGSGVGQVVARTLAGAGARLAVVGRRIETLRQTQEQIEAAGGICFPVAADVTEQAGVEAALGQVRQALGEVAIVVNNAGVHGGFDPITRSDPASWWGTMRTNLYGPYLLCRLCAPAMLAVGEGVLINVSSAAGLGGVGSQGSDYALSKYALNFFTRQLASELEGTPVACCAIHPGEVRSRMWETIRQDALARGEEGRGALGWVDLVERTGGDPPEKAAALILRLVQTDPTEVNGRFHWIEGGIQPPRETW